MALLSPGIETPEQNLAATIGSASTGRGAMVGKFEWGPAFQVTQVSSETSLVQVFGSSNNYTAASHMTANNFLKYANDLRIVRLVDGDVAKNSSALHNAIDFTVSIAAHSGYVVGDSIDVKFGATTVTVNNKGRVTKTGTNGTITAVYIPSAEIIADMKTRGETDLTGYTVEVSTSSGGSGASISLSLIESSPIYYPNLDTAYDSLTTDGAGTFYEVSDKLGFPLLSACYPGSFTDNINVFVINKADFDTSITPAMGQLANGNVEVEVYPSGGTRTINVKSYFQFGPQNDDQYCIIVQIGESVAEAFIVSTREADKDANGQTIFMDDYFNAENSQYIYATATNWLTNSAMYELSGGVDDSADSSAWLTAWDMLADKETVYTNLLIAGNVADEPKAIASVVQKYATGIADQRQDAVLLVSPPKELLINKTTEVAVKNMVAWRKGRDENGNVVDDNFNIDSTYVIIDSNYKYQYDKFSSRNRWVPLAGDIAGLCTFTDQVAQPWMSPAGFNRGQIRNVIKLAVDTRETHRNALYEIGMNPVVSFSGIGFVLYGDKTATQKASAMDRINVRRLFNLLKKSIGDAARFKLFELNDEFTRSSFKSEVDSYLDNIRALGGIYDFRVVCNETNNTAAVIDANQFVASIYIKPARSINFITLNFIATSTGADFDEIIG